MTVPVETVRPMAVDVLRLFVNVLVGVGLPDPRLVRMVVVPVRMDMGVRMRHPVVTVGMDVLFADDEPDRGSHEQSRRRRRRPDPVAQDGDRGQGARERGQAE